MLTQFIQNTIDEKKMLLKRKIKIYHLKKAIISFEKSLTENYFFFNQLCTSSGLT